jgi:hypothetical protein
MNVFCPSGIVLLAAGKESAFRLRRTRRPSDKSWMAYNLDRRPGAWVSGQAARRSALVWAFGAELMAVALFSIGLILSGRATIFTSVLVIALAVLLKLKGEGAIDAAMPWRWGAKAQLEVGRVLDSLRREGYEVRHDVQPGREANLDHVVSGPNGVYIVETKSHRFKATAPKRAKGQAKWLRHEVGVWVTPVICVLTRRKPAFQADGVWVVPAHSILDCIRSQSNKSADPAQFKRWLDSL